MRLTKRTNISMRVLMYCAAHEGRLVTKSEIAECCNASENHLAQVINRLGQLGFLHTQRLLEAGRRQEAECFDAEDNTCPLVEACLLRPAIAEAIEAFYARMDRVTLAELVCGNGRLLQIMAPQVACGRAAAV